MISIIPSKRTDDHVPRKKYFSHLRRIVIKVGTAVLTTEEGDLNQISIKKLAKEISKLNDLGIEVILVSSGAIAAGKGMMPYISQTRDLATRQALAAVGQGILMREYANAFSSYNKKVAQVLLTYDSFSNRIKYANLKNALERLLEMNVLPILNENDSITSIHDSPEIIGNNDNLSALVASRLSADLLIILSDIEGLFSENPKKNKDALLIREVRDIAPELENKYVGKAGKHGTGGMRAKIKAARMAAEAGIPSIIANGSRKDVLLEIIDGKDIGTIILPKEKVSATRQWIGLAKPEGIIVVDQGAMQAITAGKKSLLAAGIKEVHGYFKANAVVNLVCEGMTFGKGIVVYGAEDLKKIKGKQSEVIEEIIKNKKQDEVIHHNKLIVMEK